MPPELIEPGDYVHFDHVWGEERVNSIRTRPAHVPHEGVGRVERYSKDRRNLIVTSQGRKYRVPREHARLHTKGGQQEGLF